MDMAHLAFEEFQRDMLGEAERVGWTTEQDVVDYCKEIRKELWEKSNDNHVVKIKQAKESTEANT